MRDSKTGRFLAEPEQERYNRQIRKTATCWLWTGDKDTHGYGVFIQRRNPKKRIAAHRYALLGATKSTLYVLHRCDTPLCVNPEHLYLGTHSRNVLDTIDRGQHNKSKLLPNVVLKIREEYANGKSIPQLAQEHGVCHSSAWKIVRRLTWKHV